ncbi:hypothetical protein NC652_012479 [Populus alba x Populus x berolinensis]|nr:hypothetical protein NC652_012479 [Populus alba x Populus x berolinensis]
MVGRNVMPNTLTFSILVDGICQEDMVSEARISSKSGSQTALPLIDDMGCSGDSDVARPCILVSILMPPAKFKGVLIDLKSSGQGKTLLMILWI